MEDRIQVRVGDIIATCAWHDHDYFGDLLEVSWRPADGIAYDPEGVTITDKRVRRRMALQARRALAQLMTLMMGESITEFDVQPARPRLAELYKKWGCRVTAEHEGKVLLMSGSTKEVLARLTS